MASNYKKIYSLFLIFCYSSLPVLASTPPNSTAPKTDYCKLPCKEKHTVCQRKNQCGSVGSTCEMVSPSPEFRNLMVKLHNEYRNGIASGKETAFGNKGAKMMFALSYDTELEYIAGCHCNQCRGLEHDKCRSTSRFDCGQNIYMGSNLKDDGRGVKLWYEEIKDIADVSYMQKFPSYPENDGKQRGHFTQVIWANTSFVGCARAINKKDPKMPQIQLFCNYGPAGNMVGDDVYSLATNPSEIASGCKEKDAKYPALCRSLNGTATSFFTLGNSKNVYKMLNDASKLNGYQTGGGGENFVNSDTDESEDDQTSKHPPVKEKKLRSPLNGGERIVGDSKFGLNLLMFSIFYVFVQISEILN